MSARSAVKERPAEPRPRPALPTVVAVPPPTVRPAPPASEEKPTATFRIGGDPLWGMAIASIILFGLLAALMAMG